MASEKALIGMGVVCGETMGKEFAHFPIKEIIRIGLEELGLTTVLVAMAAEPDGGIDRYPVPGQGKGAGVDEPSGGGPVEEAPFEEAEQQRDGDSILKAQKSQQNQGLEFPNRYQSKGGGTENISCPNTFGARFARKVSGRWQNKAAYWKRPFYVA